MHVQTLQFNWLSIFIIPRKNRLPSRTKKTRISIQRVVATHEIPFSQLQCAIAAGGELQTRSEAHEAKTVLTISCSEKDHNRANMSGAFQKAGIYPLNPKAVLDEVPLKEIEMGRLEAIQTEPTTSMTPADHTRPASRRPPPCCPAPCHLPHPPSW